MKPPHDLRVTLSVARLRPVQPMMVAEADHKLLKVGTRVLRNSARVNRQTSRVKAKCSNSEVRMGSNRRSDRIREDIGSL
jgi:hypothetical protein